jgi:protein TonB
VFDMLIESKKSAAYGGAFGGGTISIVLHAVVITAAVYATMHAKEVVRKVQHVYDITLQTQEKKEPPPPQQELATVAAPPKGFQTLAIPTNIPINIPPPSANTSFNAADFSGVGVEGGLARGVVGGTGPVIRTDQPYLESVVEERPEMINHPVLHYPEILRQAGIEGHVMVGAIIDTLGRAERGSIVVLSSTNALFDQPSKEAVASSVFRAGRIAGHAVRVRVQIPINFTLNKGGLGGP